MILQPVALLYVNPSLSPLARCGGRRVCPSASTSYLSGCYRGAHRRVRVPAGADLAVDRVDEHHRLDPVQGPLADVLREEPNGYEPL